MPQLNWLNTCSALIFVLTLWIIRRRFANPPDWNRALYYYLALVLYARGFEGIFRNDIIFAGVVCALFIRFEFLGKHLMNGFRVIEFLVHLYVLWTTFQILFFIR
jgi:hypothetical protein